MDSSNKPPLHITDPLYQTRVASPLGELTLIASDHGVRRLLFPQQELIEHHAQMRSDHPLFTEVAAQLATYFAGERTRFELPLDLIGTESIRPQFPGAPVAPDDGRPTDKGSDVGWILFEARPSIGMKFGSPSLR